MMTPTPAAFAIPGDITTLTGGYIYERRLLEGLRARGRDVAHIELGASFPCPTPDDMADAASQLASIGSGRPLILDGLVFGSIDTTALAQVRPPIVAMIHHPLAQESGLGSETREHLFRTERANLGLAAHVLVPSRHTAELLESDYDVAPDRITIARPGTDRPVGRAQPAEPPLILSVGIQHPRKGHDILLRALARLPDLAWQAVIVGSRYDESHAASLDILHRSLGLADRVTLAGQVPAGTLSGLYGKAAIFALATRYEGYGIVFDEAMAHGLPIVSCRTGAVPATVAKDAGLLVAPEDPEAFAGALRQLLTHPQERDRMSAASRQAGDALPGWETTADIAGRVLDRLGARGDLR
jgi:glycosyltransferase involved in cell wall biosynthesis